MPLDPSLYLAYPTRTKGFDSSIFSNYTSYIPRNVYLVLEQFVVPPTYTLYSFGNQFLILVQLVTNKDRQVVQQLITTPVPTIIQIIISLQTYVSRSSTHQPLNGK